MLVALEQPSPSSRKSQVHRQLAAVRAQLTALMLELFPWFSFTSLHPHTPPPPPSDGVRVGREEEEEEEESREVQWLVILL